jgi:uncharacterized membrane protein YkvA (DUF1232 family)
MESVVIAGMFCGTLILLTFIVLSSFPESRLRSVAMEFGKWMIAMFCLALVLSPIDILPDVIPIVGWGDDIGYLIGAISAAKSAWEERKKRGLIES